MHIVLSQSSKGKLEEWGGVAEPPLLWDPRKPHSSEATGAQHPFWLHLPAPLLPQDRLGSLEPVCHWLPTGLQSQPGLLKGGGWRESGCVGGWSAFHHSWLLEAPGWQG